MELNSSSKNIVIADASFIPVSATGNMVTTTVKDQLTEIDTRFGMGVGMKNKIINGNFDIWQRGISGFATGGAYTSDRWANYSAGSTMATYQQTFILGQTDVPNNPKYFSRTVINSVTGASNSVSLYTKIEGVSTLSGKTATISFWAKADVSKYIAVGVDQYFGTGGSPSAETITGVNKINLTTTWNKYTITIAIPSISGKTIGTNNNDSLQLLFWLDTGGTITGGITIPQQSATVDIAQVQLEEGNIATNFEQRIAAHELLLCQRYYQSLYFDLFTNTNASAGLYSVYIQNFSQMRTIPTVTTAQDYIANVSNLAIVPISASVVKCQYQSTAAGGTEWAGHAYLNAEL